MALSRNTPCQNVHYENHEKNANNRKRNVMHQREEKKKEQYKHNM